MSWQEKLTGPEVLVPLVTGGATALAAAVRALWLRLIVAPLTEAAAREVVLRQERDDALRRLDEERRDHLKTLRLTERLSTKLGLAPGSDSSPPPSS